ncbi:MAG TPA: MaoC family dehydratase N-terminal domain-containing protein [Mycobacteriales bacterium]|nr:MaoC family dehydratase N-terminal domain-containing protein [Mycobacteriales bacterium]
MTQTRDQAGLDTTEVDKYVGKPVGGGQLKEPVTVTDIRRWVQGMHYPNPLHYEDEYAEASTFGRIVAPQSFTICCDVGHGAVPAIVGNIPGTHMIFGGDEWWFAGPRIYPGDKLRSKRRFVDYKVTDTKFAGPTMFSRGETVYVNQRGDVVAKQWSTAVRYRADVARDKGFFEQTAPRPTWTTDKLDQIEKQRLEWIRSRAGATSPAYDAVEVGQRLPTRPIGPHTLSTMATEWRSYIFTVWGSSVQEGHDHILEAVWLDEMDRVRRVDGCLVPGLSRAGLRRLRRAVPLHRRTASGDDRARRRVANRPGGRGRRCRRHPVTSVGPRGLLSTCRRPGRASTKAGAARRSTSRR